MAKKLAPGISMAGVQKRRNTSLGRRKRPSSDEFGGKALEKLAANPEVKLVVRKGKIIVVGSKDGRRWRVQQMPNGKYVARPPRRRPIAPGVIEVAPARPHMEGLRGVKSEPRKVQTTDTQPEPPNQPKPKPRRFWFR